MKSSQSMPWFGEVQDTPDFITITSSTYTVKATDMGKTIICNSSSAQTITVPLFGTGFSVNILRIGAGSVTIAGGTGVTVVGNALPVRYITTPVSFYSATVLAIDSTGSMQTRLVTFTEAGAAGVYTGSVVLPVLSWLHGIQVTSSVLWGAGTSATMIVGDTADDDGYFTGVNVKATDLVVGEVLDTAGQGQWGGKEGAYLVAASGRSGPTSTNFGRYYEAGTTITGKITTVGTTSTVGRTFMKVIYSVGDSFAASYTAS